MSSCKSERSRHYVQDEVHEWKGRIIKLGRILSKHNILREQLVDKLVQVIIWFVKNLFLFHI